MKGVRKGGAVGVVLVAAAALGTAAWAHGTRSAGASVKVTEKEWSVTPVPPKVKAGKVTFVVHNAGKLSHEFIVIRTNKAPNKLPLKGAVAVTTGKVGGVAAFKPGQTKTLTLSLKPGKYVLICNLPAHYQAGQRGAFTVG